MNNKHTQHIYKIMLIAGTCMMFSTHVFAMASGNKNPDGDNIDSNVVIPQVMKSGPIANNSASGVVNYIDLTGKTIVINKQQYVLSDDVKISGGTVIQNSYVRYLTNTNAQIQDIWIMKP